MVSRDVNILVVEDDSDIREVVTLILEAEGYKVMGLDNGRAVLGTVHLSPPDLILLDVMLGDSDGRDICRILKQQPETKNIPIIIVSATHGRNSTEDKGCGADDYVEKPFDVASLLTSVHRFAA